MAPKKETTKKVVESVSKKAPKKISSQKTKNILNKETTSSKKPLTKTSKKVSNKKNISSKKPVKSNQSKKIINNKPAKISKKETIKNLDKVLKNKPNTTKKSTPKKKNKSFTKKTVIEKELPKEEKELQNAPEKDVSKNPKTIIKKTIGNSKEKIKTKTPTEIIIIILVFLLFIVIITSIFVFTKITEPVKNRKDYFVVEEEMTRLVTEYYEKNLKDKNFTINKQKVTLSTLEKAGIDISTIVNPKNNKPCSKESYSYVILAEKNNEYEIKNYLVCGDYITRHK